MGGGRGNLPRHVKNFTQISPGVFVLMMVSYPVLSESNVGIGFDDGDSGYCGEGEILLQNYCDGST